MGYFSCSLYGNDASLDARDTYRIQLELTGDDEEALKRTKEILEEFMGTDEECLVWYALADTQWKIGRLCDEVKEKAFEFLAQNGGEELFEGREREKWGTILRKLEDKLNSPMKPYKKIKKLEPLELWNMGDVYAYQFSTKKAEDAGIYKKYILMQKIGEETMTEDMGGFQYDVIQIYDRLFDELPDPEVIKDIRLLPADIPYRENEELLRTFPLDMSAGMDYLKTSEYPRKRLQFLGNVEIPIKTEYVHGRVEDFGWERIEECWLVSFYKWWQGKTYYEENGLYYPSEIYKESDDE